MKKYKTVKEVCALTGLNRKLLHDYDVEGIVKPSSYQNMGYEDKEGHVYDGYKLYDEAAVVRLQQIAIFKTLGLERREIKARMSSEKCDTNSLLEEQIQMLYKKKQEIEEKIIVAEQLKIIGLRSKLNQYYTNTTFSEIAKQMVSWENSPHKQKLEAIFDSPSTEFVAELEGILDELFSYVEDERTFNETKEVVKNLFEVIKKYYGFGGWFMISAFMVSIQGGGEILTELIKEIDEETILKISNVAVLYLKDMFDELQEEFTKLIVKYYDAVYKDFDDDRVKELTIALKILLQDYIGLEEQEEYDMLFELLHTSSLMNGTGYLSFALRALEYYSN